MGQTVTPETVSDSNENGETVCVKVARGVWRSASRSERPAPQVTGFVLAGIGQRDGQGNTNFMVRAAAGAAAEVCRGGSGEVRGVYSVQWVVCGML